MILALVFFGLLCEW